MSLVAWMPLVVKIPRQFDDSSAGFLFGFLLEAQHHFFLEILYSILYSDSLLLTSE